MTGGKASLAELTAKRISDLILIEKRYSPGERIPSEYELANELGVSRLTVREAIKTLVANGILYIRRGVGTFVSDKKDVPVYGAFFTQDKRQRIKESLETREIIEPEIAALAARRASSDDINEIRLWADKCKEELSDGKFVYESDRAFHIAVAKAAHNDILYRIMTTLEFTIDSTQLAFSSDESTKAIFDDGVMLHFEVLRFIEEKDEKGAAFAMRHHFNELVNALDFK